MTRARKAVRPAGIAWPLLLVTLSGLTGCDQPLEAVVLRVHHRVFTDFNEVHRARPGETFAIGDTDYTARIIGFLPDFVYDDNQKKAVTRSSELRNPAVQLEVLENGKVVEEIWAFRGEGPPHFGRATLLAFQIEELVWKPGRQSADPASGDSSGVLGDSIGSGATSPANPTGKE